MGIRIPDRDSTGQEIVNVGPFSISNGFRFRGKGMAGTAYKNSETNIDLRLTEERWINGIVLICENHVFGDHGHFEIVDVDNVLGYGAGFVLDRFAEDWAMIPGQACQGQVLIPYPARILANLCVRIIYHSVGTENDVNVRANLFLHKKTT